MYARTTMTLAAVVAVGIAAMVGSAMRPAAAGVDSAAPEKDREAILAMQGDYRVLFRFEETLIYEPSDDRGYHDTSRAFETVRLIEDRGDFLSFQHLLVVVDEDGESHVVKHWRQDWQYEPETILEFQGHRTWTATPVPEDQRAGAWSQTVYQVDDCPRYSGYAKWRHVGDYSYWESNETWRPLPRREKKRGAQYDVLVGENRVSITPEGWAHEQDNYKLDLDSSGNRVLAREKGLNTYTRVDDFDFSPAKEYWSETKAFWDVVRGAWADVIDEGGALHVAESVRGQKSYERIMDLSKQYSNGELTVPNEARKAVKKELQRFTTVRGTD